MTAAVWWQRLFDAEVKETVTVYCEFHAEHLNTHSLQCFEYYRRWYSELPLCFNLHEAVIQSVLWSTRHSSVRKVNDMVPGYGLHARDSIRCRHLVFVVTVRKSTPGHTVSFPWRVDLFFRVASP